MISKEYLAGVMDSDDSFSLVRKKHTNPRGYIYRVCVQIGWKSSEDALKVFTEIVAVYGGSINSWMHWPNT